MRRLSRTVRMARVCLALAALTFSACSEPDWATVVGTLNADPDRTIALTVPSQVTAGTTFNASIQTVGSQGCIRLGRTDLSVNGSLARLVPYDEVPAAGSIPCFRNLVPISHSHDIQFATPGPATIRVIGYFGQDAQAELDSVDVAIEVGP